MDIDICGLLRSRSGTSFISISQDSGLCGGFLLVTVPLKVRISEHTFPLRNVLRKRQGE